MCPHSAQRRKCSHHCPAFVHSAQPVPLGAAFGLMPVSFISAPGSRLSGTNHREVSVKRGRGTKGTRPIKSRPSRGSASAARVGGTPKRRSEWNGTCSSSVRPRIESGAGSVRRPKAVRRTQRVATDGHGFGERGSRRTYRRWIVHAWRRFDSARCAGYAQRERLGVALLKQVPSVPDAISCFGLW